MQKLLTSLALTASLLVTGTSGMLAQTFVPPSAFESTHVNPLIVRPEFTACYSLSGSYTSPIAYGQADMYLAGWGLSIASSEFIWQFTVIDDPTTVLAQGSFIYSDVTNMEVGSVRNKITNRTNILVAYYKQGVGHFVDVYEVTTSVAAPVSFVTSITLSHSPVYGRIRIDCNSVYAAGIVWDDAGNGIQTIMNDGGNWSPVSTLDGTIGQAGPDIAFSYNHNKLNVHYVYHDNAGTITESVIDFNDLLTPPGITVYPTIQDVDFTGSPIGSKLVLDCPDNYGDADNWAYTYTDASHQKVYVRFIDNNSAAVPTTAIVNDGTLGITSIAGMYDTYTPTLHYGSKAIGGHTEQIHVGWYITDGSFNGYIDVEMNTDGTSIVSTPDYLMLPNAFTPNHNVFSNGIAFSKSDLKSVPNYLYATYYDYNNVTNMYQLHHAYHKWGDIAFKGTSINEQEHAVASYFIHPNPFRNSLNASVTLQDKGVLQFRLLDITGRQVWQLETTLSKGTHKVTAEDLDELIPGTYVLTAMCNGQKIGTQIITKQ